MKTIGMIGGMSWESSLEYYRIVNETVRERLGGLRSAKILLYSLDMAEIAAMQHAGDWSRLTQVMIEAADSLGRGGADFGIICTNTMHKVADELSQRASLPMLHIAEAVGQEIIKIPMQRVGLLGTKFTMEEAFYHRYLQDNFALETIVPQPEVRDEVHRVIYQELCVGVIRDDSRAYLQQVLGDLAEAGAEGVVLGCTELPLLLQGQKTAIPVFDTTRIHAVAAVDRALA